MLSKLKFLIPVLILTIFLSGCNVPPVVCGNQICDVGLEDDPNLPTYCPEDCGVIEEPVCGDDVCEAGEDNPNMSTYCPEDCGGVSGETLTLFLGESGITDSGYLVSLGPGAEVFCHVSDDDCKLEVNLLEVTVERNSVGETIVLSAGDSGYTSSGLLIEIDNVPPNTGCEVLSGDNCKVSLGSVKFEISISCPKDGCEISEVRDMQPEPVFNAGTYNISITAFMGFADSHSREFFNFTRDEIFRNFPEDVNLVYRNFPLSFQEYGLTSALAGECAHEQGMFWEFAQKVYEINPDTLDSDFLKRAFILVPGERDTIQFDKCLDEQKYLPEVAHDVLVGEKKGVSGTPTFFLSNGSDEIKIVGNQPYSEFENAINKLLGVSVEELEQFEVENGDEIITKSGLKILVNNVYVDQNTGVGKTDLTLVISENPSTGFVQGEPMSIAESETKSSYSGKTKITLDYVEFSGSSFVGFLLIDSTEKTEIINVQDVLTLELYLPFNGNFEDASGQENVVIARYGDAKTVNDVAEFDGAGDYLEVEKKNLYSDEMTISVWANPKMLSAMQSVVEVTGSNTTQRAAIAIKSSNNNRIWLVHHDKAKYWDNVIRANEWTHITGVLDNSNLELYVNGEKINGGTEINATDAGTTNLTRIGKIAADVSYPAFLNGKIDELRIYNGKLSAADIKDLYVTTKPPSGAMLSCIYPLKSDGNPADFCYPEIANRNSTISANEKKISVRYENLPYLATATISYEDVIPIVDLDGDGDISAQEYLKYQRNNYLGFEDFFVKSFLNYPLLGEYVYNNSIGSTASLYWLVDNSGGQPIFSYMSSLERDRYTDFDSLINLELGTPSGTIPAYLEVYPNVLIDKPVCGDRVCNKPTEETSCPEDCQPPTCTEYDDSGREYNKRGYVRMGNDIEEYYKAYDECEGSFLLESYCAFSQIGGEAPVSSLIYVSYPCPNACRNGACVD